MDAAQGCRRYRELPLLSTSEVLTCYIPDFFCLPTGLSAFRKIEMWVGSLAGPLGQVLCSRSGTR